MTECNFIDDELPEKSRLPVLRKKCQTCGKRITVPQIVAHGWPQIEAAAVYACQREKNQAAEFKQPTPPDRPKRPPSVPLTPAANTGPGTQLKILLAQFGIKSTATCSCNARARTMDEKGPQWCEDNIDLIVSWLREEAQKRRLPFVEMAAKILIKRAIARARKAAK